MLRNTSTVLEEVRLSIMFQRNIVCPRGGDGFQSEFRRRINQPMDQVLHIPELLELIFSHFDPVSDSKTLAYASRVRPFSDLASGMLWLEPPWSAVCAPFKVRIAASSLLRLISLIGRPVTRDPSTATLTHPVSTLHSDGGGAY